MVSEMCVYFEDKTFEKICNVIVNYSGLPFLASDSVRQETDYNLQHVSGNYWHYLQFAVRPDPKIF